MEHDTSVAGIRRFGAFLRQIREARKLSLDSVEEMTSGYPERVTKSHLSRIENGHAVPTFPRLIALGQVYGVPISRLAERFELEFVREAAPDLSEKPLDEIVEAARGLRRTGRYAEALSLLSAALDRETARRAEIHTIIDLRLQVASCLTHLGRLDSAKQEAEDLLSLRALTREQRLLALQFFIAACFRLGRLTIAELALEQATSEAGALPSPSRTAADLATLRGNILHATGRFAEAIPAYGEALTIYEALSVPFEACRARILLAGARIENGDTAEAERDLLAAMMEAETAGFDRHRALALSLLATAAYRRDDLGAAESFALRSNALARSRDYPTLVFRNCFYLWKIAESNGDEAAARMNVRSLKTFLGRIEESLPEADSFRAFLERGEA